MDLSNCTTKSDLKEVTGIDTSMIASKTDLAILKTKVNYLDVDKLKTVPAGLGKLSNVVDDDVIRKYCVWYDSHQSKYYWY